MDWDQELYGLSVDEGYVRFVDILYDSFDSYVPIGDDKLRRKPLWLQAVPGQIVGNRKHAWRNYKAVRARFGRNSPVAVAGWFHFRDMNRQFRESVRIAVSDYELSLLGLPNPRCFHSYLRRRKVERPAVGLSLLIVSGFLHQKIWL